MVDGESGRGLCSCRGVDGRGRNSSSHRAPARLSGLGLLRRRFLAPARGRLAARAEVTAAPSHDDAPYLRATAVAAFALPVIGMVAELKHPRISFAVHIIRNRTAAQADGRLEGFS